MLALLVLLLVLGFAGVARADDSFDTRYDRYFLREVLDPATSRPLVLLTRDDRAAESASVRDTGEPYRFEYYNYYDLATKLTPVERTLMIGGGTFSYPRLFVAAESECDDRRRRDRPRPLRCGARALRLHRRPADRDLPRRRAYLPQPNHGPLRRHLHRRVQVRADGTVAAHAPARRGSAATTRSTTTGCW